MRIVSKIRNRGDGPIYYFSANANIPIGAEVVVEWDDKHSCKESRDGDIKVRRTEGSSEWWTRQGAGQEGHLGAGWLGPIFYCPCCGRRLAD